MSYTERLLAKASRLLGVVAERCVKVGAVEPIVDKAGAEELEWLNISDDLSGGGGP